jgi:hypothetical protein
MNIRDRRRFIIKHQQAPLSPAVLVWDTFTDTNGTLLTAHTPDRSPAPWSAVSGSLQINSNKCTGASGSAIINTAQANISALVTITGTTGTAGFLARYLDSANYWELQASISTNEIKLWEQTSGVWSLRGASSVTLNDANPHILRAILIGTSITFWADSITPLTYTSSSHLTNVKHGIKTNTTSTSFDNFKVTIP